MATTNNNGPVLKDNNEEVDLLDKSNNEATPVAPDGGWGWMILFSSFLINVIVDGVCFTVGLLTLEFQDYFQESKAKTSLVASVLNGMYLSVGPIVSVLASRFGCRAVTIAGSFVASVAYILCRFSSNIDVAIVTYGALGGFGFGLMYLPAIVMVGHYFEKKRAFATGIAVCGSGIGAFVFAPLVEKLLAFYSWKGATIIIAGICLHGVICGALFRPLPAPSHSAPEPSNICNKHTLNSDAQLLSANGKKPHSPLLEGYTSSLTYLPPPKGVDVKPTQHRYACLSHSCDIAALTKEDANTEAKSRRVRDLQQPLYKKDIFYSGSLFSLPEFYSSRNESKPAAKEASTVATEKKSMIQSLRSMTDFSLLKDPVFAIYGTSCFLCMTGFFIPFVYLPDIGVNYGFGKERAAFLVSIIGIANTVARVATGWVSDRPWADCLLINNVALIIGGAATVACPFLTKYWLLCIYCVVFGCCIAAFVSLRSIIMVELMGLERLTSAFGMVTMCQGLSAFIGAPIAGLMFDMTGNYHLSFYFAGITLSLAGAICLPLRRIARWQKEKQSKTLVLRTSDNTSNL